MSDVAIPKWFVDKMKELEGVRLESYRDPVGVWTVGIGHTAAAGHPIPGPNFRLRSEHEAEVIFKKDFQNFLTDIKKHIEPHIWNKMTDEMKLALGSFAFNVGVGNFKKSTLLRKLNAEDYEGAGDEFKRWVYAGGRKLPGLVKRREWERDLFMYGYDKMINAPEEASILEEQNKVEPIPDEKPNPWIVGILGFILGVAAFFGYSEGDIQWLLELVNWVSSLF